MIWREHLQARLLDLQPASVCALDERSRALSAQVLPSVPISMLNTQGSPSCALALGIDALKGLSGPQAEQLISQIRLYAAPRILLAVQPDCALDAEAFRALGFELSATDPVDLTRVYFYDLDTYKTVPDWLNDRHWAHPERWEP